MGVKGRAGRRPKTAAQRKLDGSEARKTHHRQPMPVAGEPVCPSWLSDEAKCWWAEYAALLRAQHRLTVDTGPWLVKTSEAMVEWMQWREAARTSPLIVETEGGPKAHPAHVQIRIATQAMMKLLVEAGLTPTSISRIAMPAEDDAERDDFSTFQAQRGPTALRRVK